MPAQHRLLTPCPSGSCRGRAPACAGARRPAGTRPSGLSSPPRRRTPAASPRSAHARRPVLRTRAPVPPDMVADSRVPSTPGSNELKRTHTQIVAWQPGCAVQDRGARCGAVHRRVVTRRHGECRAGARPSTPGDKRGGTGERAGARGRAIELQDDVLQRLVHRKVQAHVRHHADHARQPALPQSDHALLRARGARSHATKTRRPRAGRLAAQRPLVQARLRPAHALLAASAPCDNSTAGGRARAGTQRRTLCLQECRASCSAPVRGRAAPGAAPA